MMEQNRPRPGYETLPKVRRSWSNRCRPLNRTIEQSANRTILMRVAARPVTVAVPVIVRVGVATEVAQAVIVAAVAPVVFPRGRAVADTCFGAADDREVADHLSGLLAAVRTLHLLDNVAHGH